MNIKKLLSISALVILALPAEAGWNSSPPGYIPLNSPIHISVALENWSVASSNPKVQVVWAKDPTGKWHRQTVGTFGFFSTGKDDTRMDVVNFFTIPGVWTIEVVVQTSPVGVTPPNYLFQILAGPTALVVSAPKPTPTPTPTHTPTPTPSPTPTPTPPLPTPTPTPTPSNEHHLFK